MSLQSALPPEVLASIIIVAGKWAVELTNAPRGRTDKHDPSTMFPELKMNFAGAFQYLYDKAQYLPPELED